MRTYGIELETSSISIPTAQSALNAAGLNTWQAKYDGTGGVDAECVSPILTDESLNETLKAARTLLRAGATVNRQTGYHVHLGADQFGLNGIAATVRNWYTAADAIGALVAKSRLNNRYCKHDFTPAQIDSWTESIRNGNIDNRGANATRFVSLNLNAYSAHGTIEFRLHHGTLNGKKIQAWAEFVQAIAEYSTAGGILRANTDAGRLNDCHHLLDVLAENHLDIRTAEYLKQRAIELQTA